MPCTGRTELCLVIPPSPLGLGAVVLSTSVGKSSFMMAGVPAEKEDKASGRPKTHPSSLSTPFEHLEGGCQLAELRLRETARVMRSESHTHPGPTAGRPQGSI